MEQQQKDPTCEERIKDHLESRLEDFKDLWEGYCNGAEEKTEDFYNYGLCFDYVSQDTFEDQECGYFRYQISWGGPSDEFRFYCDPEFNCYKIEYAFLDWFDGATRRLYDEDKKLMLEIFDCFKECGTVEHEFNKAIES